MSSTTDDVASRIARMEERITAGNKTLVRVDEKLDKLIVLEERSMNHDKQIQKLEDELEGVKEELSYWKTFRRIGMWLLGISGSILMLLLGYYLNNH
ncbi:hypothetical protein [Beggiatoa leptomitoformis]|uniref:Uncharacterized protein n=1 Tax=Beggiatoa leptomitoformis TaxID=288004 RepID=A0A2N9YI08_9GAMM|nr:hypothetical protein [Beggiatoa leptomitoformis]ALG67882.1 hypothetical protein AL038_09370 [Beggiatoa leptomitoformis]AUI69856.1 hypothetical protein BLE401_14930 [Beggiatoa leptomitoformis]